MSTLEFVGEIIKLAFFGALTLGAIALVVLLLMGVYKVIRDEFD